LQRWWTSKSNCGTPRGNRGMTMLAISQKTRVSYSAIHSFMASKRGMTLATASKLADLFGLELRPKARNRKA
jgi:ribosome-binding protein aMBF1 (putative translation factor)